MDDSQLANEGRCAVSEKYIGIAGVVLGVLLLILSARSDPTLEVAGVICLAGGGILLLRGLNKERAQKKATSATVALSGHEEEIDGLLKEGRSLTEIALDCQQRFGVSADLMLIIATLRLREWLTSDEPHLREIAERTVAAGVRDVSLAPEQVLGRLHEDGVALHYDETATASVMPPSLRAGLKGALVLTSSYLFFLARKESADEALGDVFRDLPLVGQGVVVVDILQGVGEQYKNPFTEKRAKKLAERLKMPGSFAIPLGKVRRMSAPATFEPRSCLEVEWTGVEGEPVRRWLDTTLREVSFMDEPQPETWVRRWTDRLRLIALASGNNLYSVPSDRSGKYTFSAASRTAAHSGDEFRRPEHRRALKLAGLFLGGLVSVFLLSLLLQLVSWPKAALIVLLGGIVLFVPAAFFASRRINRPGEGLNRALAGAPQVLEVLRAPGGLARLAEATHGRYGTPIARGRLAAAQVIVKAAQSGEVADRRDARLLALAQRTDDIEAPEASIRRLDPDQHVYFPALPATLYRAGEGEASREGALVLTTRYLFFLAGGVDLRPVETADGGIAFDAATITRVESLFRAEHSLAIPMRAITRLEMTEDEHPSLVLQAEVAGSGPERTLRWRLGDGRPDVEAGKIALWLTRVQLACAAEGNLLVWSESQPRLDQMPLPLTGGATPATPEVRAS